MRLFKPRSVHPKISGAYNTFPRFSPREGLAVGWVPIVQHMGDYFDTLLIFCALAFFTCMEYIFSPTRFNQAKKDAKATSEQVRGGAACEDSVANRDRS